MQGAVLRDTKPRRRNRLVTLLLLPVFAVMWLVGWTLYWVGGRKDEAQPELRHDRRSDHVKLFPVNTVVEKEDEEEEPVEIAAVLD